jgi:cellulose synthase/poly-beta-1,6-N-acetylglucosamine synthase-like glycosyltransferase
MVFDLTPLEVLLILIVPFIFEVPRVVLKSVLLLTKHFREKKTAEIYSPSGKMPKVSVIVPAHNEGSTIDFAINSLIDLDYPNKEIIVVDDDSKDDTYVKARPYASRGLIKLFRKTEPSSSKARAVNYGVQFASGDIIVIIDADTIITRDCLLRLIKPFEMDDVVGIAGNVRIYNDKSFLGRIQAYEYMMAMELGRAYQSIIRILLIIPGALGAFRASVFKELGEMDDDTITEDFDFALKLQKTGKRILFRSDAVGWTVSPEKWGKWIRQRVRWARGQIQTLAKHRDMIVSRKYGLRVWFSCLDMLLMDIVLLFVKLSWIVSLPFVFHNTSLLDMAIVIFVFYLLLELVQASVAVVISPRRERDASTLIVLPVIVLLYRPFYSLVRFYAYVMEAVGAEAKW